MHTGYMFRYNVRFKQALKDLDAVFGPWKRLKYNCFFIGTKYIFLYERDNVFFMLSDYRTW